MVFVCTQGPNERGASPTSYFGSVSANRVSREGG